MTLTSPETRHAQSNGIEIAYETFGDPGDAPVLLVMGLGTQMIAWPDELCADLAARGHFVVRFDNRDVGLSTHLSHLAAPTTRDLLLRRRRPPYRIKDMAADMAGLLDELGLDSAHVVGASMGGFIAQTFALKYPQRTRSLTLIMTSTGSRRVGQARPRLLVQLLRRRVAADRESAMLATLETFRVIGSPGFVRDEDYLRDLSGRSYDRAYDPRGYRRQLGAVVAQPDRTKQLARLDVPTVVLHGLADPLVRPSGGKALARTIPGAKFIGFPAMGHDLPRDLWPKFVDAIAVVAARGESRRSAEPAASAEPSSDSFGNRVD
ncbi:MAG: alpha/beta fold hydrolase [Actinomycetota bacterium]|nr:alpha/beta fold hydrolase [Actinomycetota bacterium]